MRKFKQIYFIVEGQTEFGFIKNILYKEFPYDIKLQPILIKKTGGGLVHYSHLKKEIIRQIHVPKAIVTTMIDLYALPKDFPGYNESKNIKDTYERVEFLENAIKQDIEETIGKELYHFIPYIQLHEFEALLFSDVEKFEILFDNQVVTELKQILADFKENPELINDSKETAPSKRLLKLIPEYNKTIHGLLLAEEIGITQMRKKCKHFNQWLKQLMQIIYF